SARFADKLIVLNEADRSFAVARRCKRETDSHVVRHGVSDRFLSAPPAIRERGGGLLFCGSWDEVKGVSHLAQAFSRLVRSGARINLTILGGGLSEEAIRSRFPSEAQAYLTVRARATEDEVMRQYQRHDALVFPSTYEGFGMVVVEAMSQLLPVVATSVGCAAALVKDRETGILVPPRDPAALALAADRLMKDPSLRSRLAENALAAVRDMSWRRTALETLDIYLAAKRACPTAGAIGQRS
ncbi:MAG TPA: glycosyltransferase family 4 protein, partial [Blastocatellia bacterium]|nr:glycosyltransferase family 4 protein [Blastocatellia bacterium]